MKNYNVKSLSSNLIKKPFYAFLRNTFEKLHINRIVNYLKSNNAILAKYLTFFVLKRKAKKKSIIVCTMGKVGSTTLSHTLMRELPEYFIYDVHWINKKNLDTDKKFHEIHYRDNKKKNLDVSILPDYINQGYFLNQLINREKDKEFNVITLTRDPVARNVSSFFQNLRRFFGYDFDHGLKGVDEGQLVDELSDLFVNEFIVKNKVHFIDSDPLTWFDEELKEVLNIDVFEDPFPREQGFNIYRNGNINVLLIRLEDLGRCFDKAFEKFINRTINSLVSKNVGQDKNYSTIYTRFMNKVEIPGWYLDKMYESKFAKHFYSDAELNRFRNKWMKKPLELSLEK